MPSSVNFKDISLLTQKSSVAGTEKIPVSDTEYLTASQIASANGLSVTQDGSDLEFSDENGYSIAVFYNGHIKTKNFDSSTALKYVLCVDEAAYTAIQNKDSGTLYLIPE